MTKKDYNDIKSLLGDLFVSRENGLEGVAFNIEYMKAENVDKYKIYKAVSDAMHESGLTHDFSYSVANKVVYILGEAEDWEDNDYIQESINSSIPVYNYELMTIYQDNFWAVDEAVSEFGHRDSIANAQMAWDMLMEQMLDSIKEKLLKLLQTND